MLKDKSCYANDEAYARAFFLHKGIVRDYLIDPLIGSIVRTIYPHPEQPVTEKGWFNKPQFLFLTRNDHSRMYDISDAEKLFPGIEQIYAKLGAVNCDFNISTNKNAPPVLIADNDGKVSFKNVAGGYSELISHVLPVSWNQHTNRAHLTAERQTKVTGNLLDAFHRIINEEDPSTDLLILDGEMMMALHRSDAGVRTPIIITGRKFKNRNENYIILHSGKQRMIFPDSNNISAETLLDQFMSIAKANSEDLEGGAEGDGRITMVNPHPAHGFDPNMEYVNCRVVPYESGDSVTVILNSDRYPGNTKFMYRYDREFHMNFHHALVRFAQQFKILGSV